MPFLLNQVDCRHALLGFTLSLVRLITARYVNGLAQFASSGHALTVSLLLLLLILSLAELHEGRE